MLFHKVTGFFNFLPAFWDTAWGGLPILPNQQGYEEQQLFFFAELTRTFYDQFVERVQIAGHVLIENHIFGKAGKLPFTGHFFCQVQHNFFGNVKSLVIECAIIVLDTGMVISGIEENDIAF